MKHIKIFEQFHTQDKTTYSLNEQTEGFDYDYYIGQIEAVQEATAEVNFELIRSLDAIAEDDEVYGLVSQAAEQASKQARKYIMAAEVQLDALQKLLNRAKKKDSFTD
jgi:hypothetical protein